MIYRNILLTCNYNPYNSKFKLLDPLVAAGVIKGGADLLGSIFNFGSQKATNKMQERMFNTQMDYVKAAEQRSYDYQDKAWQRETEYNSPVAQRRRFEAAGLNPSMMMEGQNAVVASMGEPSTPSAPSPPTLQAPQMDFSGIGEAVNSYYQNALLQSQMKKTDNEAYILGIDAQYSHQKHQLDLREQLGRIAKLAEDTSLSNEQRKYYSDLSESIRQEIAFNDASWNARMNQENQKAFVLNQQGLLTKEQINAQVIDNFFSELEHRLNISLSRAQIKRLKSQMAVDTSQIGINNSQAKKLDAEFSKTILEAAGLSPGTPQWEQKERQVKAMLEQARRVHLPFGFSFPDNYEEEIPRKSKNAAKRGRLF